MRTTAHRFPARRTTNRGLRLLLGAALLMSGGPLLADEAANQNVWPTLRNVSHFMSSRALAPRGDEAIPVESRATN
jgi:hypothetical protein